MFRLTYLNTSKTVVKPIQKLLMRVFKSGWSNIIKLAFLAMIYNF